MVAEVVRQKVLNIIADEFRVEQHTVFVELDTVWYYGSEGALHFACSVGSEYWNALVARVVAFDLLGRLMNHSNSTH